MDAEHVYEATSADRRGKLRRCLQESPLVVRLGKCPLPTEACILQRLHAGSLSGPRHAQNPHASKRLQQVTVEGNEEDSRRSDGMHA